MTIRIDRRLDINGVPLKHPTGRYYVEGDTIGGGIPTRDDDSIDVAGRHGQLYSGRSRARTGRETITMLVTDLNDDGHHAGWGQLVRNRDALDALIGPFNRPITLGLTPDATREPGTRRTALAKIESSSAPAPINALNERLSYVLTRIEAFWRDADPVEVTEASASFLRGGSAPITDPKIMAPGAGTATRVRIRDQITGAWIVYQGDVPAGQYVRIEPLTETAYIVANPHAWSGGTEDTAGVITGPGGFELSPEADWSATVTGVRIQARRAYQQ